MKFFRQLKSGVAKKFSGNFVRNLGWLGIAQATIRVSRLAATFILPRFLTEEDYGLAALVLTTYEFTQTLTKVGIHAKVIQSDDDEVDDISDSSYWLSWVVYISLFFLQCVVAFPIAKFYNNDKLILPICALAFTYLITPIGRIQFALIQRENRFKIVAFAQSLRYGTANILTAIFAILGMGLWAIILPRLLATPLEFIVYLIKHPWRVKQKFTTRNWGNILKFGLNVLGIQLLKTFRDNVDYLIVGRFIGIKELGFYYFAYNAGLGISLTIINSITTALYPHLCAARESIAELKQTFTQSLKTIAYIMFPFVILQSALAPFYVPILFGEQWIPAVPVLILICLSAIPRPFDVAAFHLLTAVDRPQIALALNFAFTILFTIAILIGVAGQSIGVATAVLLVHAIVIPIFVIWTTRYVFSGRFKLSGG